MTNPCNQLEPIAKSVWWNRSSSWENLDPVDSLWNYFHFASEKVIKQG